MLNNFNITNYRFLFTYTMKQKLCDMIANKNFGILEKTILKFGTDSIQQIQQIRGYLKERYKLQISTLSIQKRIDQLKAQ